ncbi:MAG: hypothetical protein DHS20C21_02480 [Gemmatimonadota bacterium]|nr:MAG: hypothetical protein DHS20C21_02480 [Gemmatimonadota bacterium]
MLPKEILKTRGGRLTAFSLLYLSEGIPFGFSAVALTTYLRQQGIGNTEIGLFTASLYAPWGFKWAWAPLVDLVRLPRFGARRFWIALSQIFMVLTLGLVWVVDPGANLPLLTTLIVVHNIFASVQDVAIDALAVQVLPPHERGTANGFMFGASYLGQFLGGSGALWIAGAFGFGLTYPYVLGLLILILLAVTLRLNEPPPEALSDTGARIGVLSKLGFRLGKYAMDLIRGFFLSGRGPVAGVVFALMPFGALALGLALGTTMMVDLGMDENNIAAVNAWATVLAALGCVVGGFVSDRIGHRKALAAWFVVTTLPTIWLSLRFTGSEGMAGITPGDYWMAALTYSFASGLITGTSAAVFMGLTSPLVAATQFSGYMAMRNLVYTYSAAWQGWFADLKGYAETLRLDALIAFIPLLAIVFLKPANPVPLVGEAAGRQLRKLAAVFCLGAPILVTLATDWRVLDWQAGMVWGAGLLALWVLATRKDTESSVPATLLVLLTGTAVFVIRCADVGWGRPAQMTLVGALFGLVALGMMLGARYEVRKEQGG